VGTVDPPDVLGQAQPGGLEYVGGVGGGEPVRPGDRPYQAAEPLHELAPGILITTGRSEHQLAGIVRVQPPCPSVSSGNAPLPRVGLRSRGKPFDRRSHPYHTATGRGLPRARAAHAPGPAANWPPAAARAQVALPMFTAQGRHWWGAHAGLLLLQARCANRPPSARLLRQAAKIAADLDLLGSSEAVQARLLAGRLAPALGPAAEADAPPAAAAPDRDRPVTALARAQGWLAEALRADAAGDRRRLLAACGRGLAILDEHQLTLGASELRAQATAHGAELAALAQRSALAAARPRLLLTWSERW